MKSAFIKPFVAIVGIVFTALIAASSVGTANSINWVNEEKDIRRIKPSQFVRVPKAVVDKVGAKGCLIPQSWDNANLHNVTSGNFASKASKDWAVLCSRDGRSSIFIVWEKEQPCPEWLAEAADKDRLQGISDVRAGYSRSLEAASKESVRAMEISPLKSEQIDHGGIEDVFVNKASVIYYCHGGKWLELPGAD